MQANRGNAEALGRKAKLARSYQELLDEFSNKDLSSVGNYTLGRLIGKGSFGKVYLATHKLTNGSKVVLKSANKGDSNLAREIHHHRQFVHPHIARLYEVIVTENLVWLVLEYCSGNTILCHLGSTNTTDVPIGDELYNYLLEHGPLPVHKVQKIFAQLVGAVAYVHQQSCVHRDLKLENILFDKHENVKLVDFGFTREYEGKSNYLQTFCGTICYSAPEMLKGEKYAGEKVDVWSLGVILYALLCGELPFDDDDDSVTRTKILSEEPRFPEHLPPAAIPLLKSLLSKRPLLRPSLPDILTNPFLAEHAPAQQAILKVQRPAPFSTHLEKETLQRMRSAGVDIDSVIESVLAQRCDALAGWWTLLIEKEQRKVRRRERRRREREAENRSLRRLSAASSRLERIAPVLQEVDEDGGLTNRFIRLEDAPVTPRTRGRSERRSAHYSDFGDLPGLPEHSKENGSPNTEEPPPPIDKDSIRSASTSRNRRPVPPPKEGVIRSARSRGSTLHLVTTSEALATNGTPERPPEQQQKVRKKPSQAIIAHWKNWTHWFLENTRRGRHANKRGSHSTPNLVDKNGSVAGNSSKHSKDTSPRPQTSKYSTTDEAVSQVKAGLPRGVMANGHLNKALPGQRGSGGFNSPVTGAGSTPSHMPSRITTSYKRQSLSPSPMTPRTTMRRSSAGLRGRKSTSSSVSSIRSMPHHHHSHSKASSTSSNGSVSTSMSKNTLQRGQSPHHSVKVLPATPTTTAFPSNIRLVRGPGPPAPLALFNEGMPPPPISGMQAPGSPNFFSQGGGIQFAKRKRNIFKGPMLAFGGGGGASAGAGGGSATRSTGSSHSRSVSASGIGRRSGEVTIQEEEEGEEAEEEIEEVDAFSPVVGGPGERIEEQIIEDGETEAAGGQAKVDTDAVPVTPKTKVPPVEA
ncbi:Serine threonine protein kinase [Colletotrichum higginsianum IMI 349063]|uniref:Serine threonine protein kinase n=1 Tax=Colletotrichum higginsianum (strain IMI 349063) TaxID=759273 RepID=A0A1B7XX44_COLHI|nr:Serine threonine protein kinase [Colletotrichum higginsianum IMI 349063]OBR04332.1 Serine threonine protein kinase [Colletotrichum higginsianum IMI 349063]